MLESRQIAGHIYVKLMVCTHIDVLLICCFMSAIQTEGDEISCWD